MKYFLLKQSKEILGQNNCSHSLNVLYKLVREKKLKAIKKGNKWYTTEKWINQFLNKDNPHSFFKHHYKKLAILLLFLIIVSTAFLLYFSKTTLGASYSFIQTEWNTEDQVNFSTHPDNQLNWDKYYSKDAEIQTGEELKFNFTNSYSLTETSDTDFNQGILTNTEIIGTGNDAYVKIVDGFSVGNWNTMTSLPAGTHYGSAFAHTNNDYIYAFQGGVSNLFYRYSISNNTWDTMTSAPETVYMGSALAYAGSDHIFAFRGYETSSFWRYSISNNTWDTMTSAPEIITGGGSLIYTGGDHIFAFRGDRTSSFWRYSISNNTWDTMTSAPATVYAGGSLVYSGANYVYALGGYNDPTFWRYSISSNTWDTMASTPENVYTGGSLAYTESDYMYANRGYDTTFFWRYSILSNTWENATSPPGNISYGGALVYGGNDNVYAFQGAGSDAFWRYNMYYTSSIESKSYDLTSQVNFSTIEFESTIPDETQIRFQIATNNDNTTWNFIGPDGTNSTYYTTSGSSINVIHRGDRYIKYKAYLLSINQAQNPYLDSVTINYGIYTTPLVKELISSLYNSTSAENVLAKVSWTENKPSNTDVKIQLSTAPDNDGAPGTWSDFVGLDGTSATYFTDPAGEETIPDCLNDMTNDQWFRYKVILETNSSYATPSLLDISIIYVVNSPPVFNPESPVSAVQNSDGTVIINYSIKDPDTSDGTSTPGYVTPLFEYFNGTSWVSCSTLAIGDLDNKAVNENTYTGYSATWYPKIDFVNQYFADTVKIKVIINDNEEANNIAYQESSTLALDTKNPENSSIAVNASTQYGENLSILTIYSEDDSAVVKMMISLNSDFEAAEWQDYDTSSSILLEAESDTVYIKFKDPFNNVSDVLFASNPNIPEALMTQDVSNLISIPHEYRMFVAWKEVPNPPQGTFDHYSILRSELEDDPNFTELIQINDIHINYYSDIDLVEADSETKFYYKIIAVDSLGNISFRSDAVTGMPNGIQDCGEGGGGTDVEAPTISNINITNIYTSQATITWDTDELANSYIDYSIDEPIFNLSQGLVTMTESHSLTLTGLTPGQTYYLKIKSTDPSSNTGFDDNSAQGYVLNTISGPVISNVSVSQIFNEEANIFWLTDISADSHIEISVNSDMSSSTSYGSEVLIAEANTEGFYEHIVTIPNLEQGTRYYFYVKSKDSELNEAQDNNEGNYYYLITTYDATSPILSEVSASTTAFTAIITFSTDELADSKVEYGKTDSYGLSSFSSILTINHYLTLTDLDEKDTYHYRIITKDKNGNEVISSDNTFIPTREADHTNPIITSVLIPEASIFTDQATITFDTDELSNSTIIYSVDQSFNLTKENTSMVEDHRVILSNLDPNTNYSFKVKAEDFDANEATPDTIYSFTTKQGPLISSVLVSSVVNQKATIEWMTNTNSTSKVYYSSSPNMDNVQTKESLSLVQNHKITLDALSQNTIYYFYLESRDESENTAISNNQENNYYFTTANDSIVPLIEDISATPNICSAVITWTTDELSTSKVIYGEDTNYINETDEDTTLTMQHVVVITGLEENTTYHYKVISSDANSNENQSSDNEFNTILSTQFDPTPSEPPVISGVEVKNVSHDKVTIIWYTNENATSKIHYDISNETYTNETEKDETLTIMHTVTLEELIPHTAYYFKVVSEDATGNVREANNEGQGYTFTTEQEPSLYDPTPNDPPEVSDIYIALVSDTSAVITWKTSDPATSKVYYGISNEEYTNETTIDETLTIKHSVTLIELTKETTYYFKIQSTDSNENTTTDDNSGEGYTLTTTKQPGDIIIQNIISSGGGSSIDRTSPTMKNITISNITSTSAEIAWKSSEQTNTFIEYGETETYEKGSYGNPYASKIKHSLTLSFLNPATTYLFKVLGLDSYGNIGSSKQQSFATLDASGNEIKTSIKNIEEAIEDPDYSQITEEDELSIVENTINIIKKLKDAYSLKFISDALQETAKKIINPPVVIDGNIQIEVTSSTAIFTWTTDKKTRAVIELIEDSKYDEKKDKPYEEKIGSYDDFVLDHEVIVSGLEPSTIYHYQIISTPIIGETSKTEDNISCQSFITYTNLRTGEKNEREDTQYLKEHEMIIDSLESDIEYSLSIKAQDEDKNIIESPTLSFRTGEDSTAPEISQVRNSMTISPQGNEVQVIISWQTDEFSTSQVAFKQGVEYVEEEMELTKIDETLVKKHVVVISDFDPGKVYLFKVMSEDLSGNASTSKNFTILTPKNEKTVFQTMIENFEQIFGWTQGFGF